MSISSISLLSSAIDGIDSTDGVSFSPVRDNCLKNQSARLKDCSSRNGNDKTLYGSCVYLYTVKRQFYTYTVSKDVFETNVRSLDCIFNMEDNIMSCFLLF
jgi:hypothetical protein